MTRARRLVLAAAVALLAPLAACGSDDDGGGGAGGGGQALSEADYLAQANAICTESSDATDAEAEEAFGDEMPTPESMESFADDVAVPNLTDMIERIRALNGPDDLEADVHALLDDAQALVEDFADLSGEELINMAMSGEDPFAELDARGDELGLTGCSDA